MISSRFLLIFVLAIQSVAASPIAKHFAPPYALRILTTARHALNNAVMQPDPESTSYGIFARDSQTSPHLAWEFHTINAPFQTEILNATDQMIIIGEKFYMWDPEPSSMIMTCPPLAHAKVGWPGEFWPSPYISVNWAFNVTRSPGGKWMLRFPFNHGEWVADVDFDPVYADRWRISWWNGTASPGLSAAAIPIEVEVISLA